ncbi:hypothetical protein ACFO5R_13585 [Halosolutus amylolyticus]|uniref:Uncharacterized protein n=1 Tax=Halosolutus amylolyticus TaxID=2932267 RepID=A0ABD5PSQ2_9EURY|nr:hypothetical protein [Halosolutus amylolyticus]
MLAVPAAHLLSTLLAVLLLLASVLPAALSTALAPLGAPLIAPTLSLRFGPSLALLAAFAACFPAVLEVRFADRVSVEARSLLAAATFCPPITAATSTLVATAASIAASLLFLSPLALVHFVIVLAPIAAVPTTTSLVTAIHPLSTLSTALATLAPLVAGPLLSAALPVSLPTIVLFVPFRSATALFVLLSSAVLLTAPLSPAVWLTAPLSPAVWLTAPLSPAAVLFTAILAPSLGTVLLPAGSFDFVRTLLVPFAARLSAVLERSFFDRVGFEPLVFLGSVLLLTVVSTAAAVALAWRFTLAAALGLVLPSPAGIPLLAALVAFLATPLTSVAVALRPGALAPAGFAVGRVRRPSVFGLVLSPPIAASPFLALAAAEQSVEPAAIVPASIPAAIVPASIPAAIVAAIPIALVLSVGSSVPPSPVVVVSVVHDWCRVASRPDAALMAVATFVLQAVIRLSGE